MTAAEKEQASANFEKSARTTADEAARIIVKGMAKKKARIFVGFDAKLIRLFSWLPASLHDRLTRMVILSRM